MSDTISTVQWFLDSDEPQFMYLPPGREHPDEVFKNAILELELSPELDQAFPPTNPRWYGLWIESPLTPQQCSLLWQIFARMADKVPRYRERLESFLHALQLAAQNQATMHVEFSPPGHVDFGMVTTFVHCPRCKAEGPFKRWQESYPDTPIACLVCGHHYSPASTHTCEREYFAEFIKCNDCQARLRVRDFSTHEIATLEGQHNLKSLLEEHHWLQRVVAFYARHPEQEGRWRPHFIDVLKSDDPFVRSEMLAGVPFDEIVLPSRRDQDVVRADWSSEDAQVAEYLQHHCFSLEGRLSSVEEGIRDRDITTSEAFVTCPQCRGEIRIT